MPQHPCCRTVICLAESVYLWGCNLSRSQQALGEGSSFDGSSWPKPFPRGLGDRAGALSRAFVWGVRDGGGSGRGPGPALVAEQTGPLKPPPYPSSGCTWVPPNLFSRKPQLQAVTRPLSQTPPHVQPCLVAKRTGTRGAHGSPLFQNGSGAGSGQGCFETGECV